MCDFYQTVKWFFKIFDNEIQAKLLYTSGLVSIHIGTKLVFGKFTKKWELYLIFKFCLIHIIFLGY